MGFTRWLTGICCAFSKQEIIYIKGRMMEKIRMILILGFIFLPALLLAQTPDSTEAIPDTIAQSVGKGIISNPLVSELGGTLESAKSEFQVTAFKVLLSLILFLIGFIVIRYFTRLLEAIAERWSQSRVTIKGVIPVFRISGWSIVIYMIIARIFAPPIETLIAVTASAGIAIGFASQDILKNIFGGIMIILDRPFQVGDKIEVGKYYGEVIHIGLRTVRIVTPGDSIVSIPNTEIVNQSVSNANAGENNCQVITEFYLDVNSDLEKAKAIAILAAKISPYTFLNKPIAVVMKNEYYRTKPVIKMNLKSYVLDIRFEFVYMSDLVQRVSKELIQSGIMVYQYANEERKQDANKVHKDV
jgi:MscS family membrane protein